MKLRALIQSKLPKTPDRLPNYNVGPKPSRQPKFVNHLNEKQFWTLRTVFVYKDGSAEIEVDKEMDSIR